MTRFAVIVTNYNYARFVIEAVDGVLAQGRRHADCFEKVLRPALAEKGLRILSVKDLDAEQRAQVDQRFREQIFPVLTPLALGLGRHFPYISNLSLSLAVLLRDPVTEGENLARVKVPKGMLAVTLRRLFARAPWTVMWWPLPLRRAFGTAISRRPVR